VATEENYLIPDLHTVPNGDAPSHHPHLLLPKLVREAGGRFLIPNSEEEAVAHSVIVRWAELESSGKLKRRKETALQGEFLAQVFGKVLGYRFFSENPVQWDLQTPFNVNGGEADAAIGRFASEGSDPPCVLIELKGPTVNVDRDRFNGRTAVQQCWDYLNAVPQCPWGIVCNYVSFRLYHRTHTTRRFELFTLQELCDRQRFREFHAVLGRGAFLPLLKGQKPLAEDLLEKTDSRQREVGREFYRAYHENRVSMIHHLRKPPHGLSLDSAIHVAQMILDRIVFVAFCEDRGLLPDKSIEKAWSEIPPFTKVTNPRWQNFLALFRSIDTGNPEFDISRFNGGLFIKDEVVDNLQLGDQWTSFFKEVGGYDFRDEVNLDVLGHLFEQSITDLEVLRSSPESWDTTPPKKVSGKRRREGIYYTPPPITRYIVEQTVGACLEERFVELAREFRVNPQGEPSPQTLAAWLKYQEARLEVLRRLRVCDPACGSGAFLIQAFDYLEVVYDDVLTALFMHQGHGDEKQRQEVNGWILRGNLFGVDRSPEAVEITRLALWIRTAERGKSLADLSQNIQCGNSIVDDPAADPLAFKWEDRFAPVFAEGGFDCVISNPPYVKLQNFRKREPRVAEFLLKRYRSAQTGNFDMYLPFIERGLGLLKPGGRMGFIAPSLWLFNEYGAGLREIIAQTRSLERFVDFKSHQVFEDATTYTALQFFRARPHEAIEVADASSGQLPDLTFHRVPYAGLSTGAWALLETAEAKVLDRMRGCTVPLADACQAVIVGIQTSADAVYHLVRIAPGRYFSKALNREVEIEDDIMKPLVSGEDAVPFCSPITDKCLIFPYLVTAKECRLLSEKEMAKRFKRCWSYLLKNEKALRTRESGKFNDDKWWRFGRHQNIDKQGSPKIMVPRLLLHLFASVDPRGHYCIDNVDVGGVLPRKGWQLHYLAAILNSKACDFVWRLTSKPFRGGYRSANKQFIAPLPIPKTSDQKPVADLARRLADLHADRLGILGGVRRRFVVDLAPPELVATSPLPAKLPGRLADFGALPLGQLIDHMEAFAKRKFTPPERGRWDKYLTAEINRLAGLDRQIRDLTGELNARVYRLYGLTDDDVKVIEGLVGG